MVQGLVGILIILMQLPSQLWSDQSMLRDQGNLEFLFVLRAHLCVWIKQGSGLEGMGV